MAFVQPRLQPLPAVFLNVQDDSPDSSCVLRRCGSYPGYTPFELNSNSGDEASETTLLGGSAEKDPAATWPDTDEEGLLGAPWANSTLGPRSEDTLEDNCKGVPVLEGLCLTPVGPPPTETGIDEFDGKGPESHESQGEAGKCCSSNAHRQPLVPSLKSALLPGREGNAQMSTQAVPALPTTANGIPISHISKQAMEAPCCPTSHTSQQVMQATRPSVTSQTSANMTQARRARAQAVRKTRRMLPAVAPEQLAQVLRSSPLTRPRRP